MSPDRSSTTSAMRVTAPVAFTSAKSSGTRFRTSVPGSICGPIRSRRMPALPGKPRTDIGAFGVIRTTVLPSGAFQAMTRFRDGDGRLRRVTATAGTRARAEAALRKKLVERDRIVDTGEAVTADTEFSKLG